MKNKRCRHGLFWVVAALFGRAGWTAPELVTDRPDQTESASIVPPRHVQIETGWTHSENDDAGVDAKTDSYAETLLRLGVRQDLEWRLGFSGFQGEDVKLRGGRDAGAHGPADSDAGFKYHLREELGWVPETAFIGGATLPTGGKDFTSRRSDPSFRFTCAHTLSDRLSLGYNLGAAWTSEEDVRGERDTVSVLEYTATLGLVLTDLLGSFIEFFGDAKLSAAGAPAHSIDGGFTWLLRENVQLDLLGGVGVSSEADDWFVGAGVSCRFPE
jgi:hypothetical protein